MTAPYQELCSKCGRAWQFNDVGVCDGEGELWHHHDCNDPRLEVALPG